MKDPYQNISSTNIYEINNFMTEVARKHNPLIDENVLYLNQFGYMIDIGSKLIQNALVSATLWSQESFPILSKMERSIMTNAVTYNVSDINAKPAKMDILFSILEDDLLRLFPSKGEKPGVSIKEDIVISRDCQFDISGFEYHLEYDIILSRNQKKDGTVIYTARYDLSNKNPNSDTINAYLIPPHFYTKNGDKFLGIYTRIEQISLEKVEANIITDNIILNKTIDFEFEGDMTYFTVEVSNVNTGEIKSLTPVVEGIINDNIEDYCLYTYVKRNNIRIKFTPDSYYPDSGSKVEICCYTTKGQDANFRYEENSDIIANLQSENYNYLDTQILITPMSESYSGAYAKSLEDIKNILPREILARNVITCEADLYNYFNKLDDTIMKFYKLRHNQIDHLYYAYMISKDYDGNIIPTNTVNIQINESVLSSLESDDNRFIIPAGTMFKMLNRDTCTIIDSIDEEDIYEAEDNHFIYSNPINLIINKDPISTSYYMDVIKCDMQLYMKYINDISINHMMVDIVHVEKIFLDGPNYEFTIRCKQTVSDNFGFIKINKETGEVEENNLKSYIVIKNGNFKYYVEAELISYDLKNYEYIFKYTLESSKYINKENKFRINNVCLSETTDKTYVDLPREIELEFLFYAKFEESYGVNDSVVPNMEEYTLMNTYNLNKTFELYYNYSNIMVSFCKYSDMSELSKGFYIEKVPMVRYSYITNRDNCFKFLDILNYKKISIDNMIDKIIKPFGINFKLFNTYGPSSMFTVGHNDQMLDRVNITLEFNLKLRPESSDSILNNIIEFIKESIENLNYLNESIHITNLTTELTNNFKDSIEFIEFVKFNKYSSDIQYFERQEVTYITDVPEFINIDLDKELQPRIKLNIL